MNLLRVILTSLSVVSTASGADPSAPALERWGLHVGTHVRQDLWISGPAECSSAAGEIQEHFRFYEAVSRSSERTVVGPRGFFKRIQKVLERYPEEHPCHDPLQAFYAIQSLAGFSYNLEPAELKEYESLISVAVALHEAGRLHPLTKKRRQEWGGAWTDSKTTILGAYQCEETRVYFEPGKKPYNTAAVLIHELEHLTRDKFSYWENPALFVRDPALTLLLDETLSTLHASYTQMSFQRDQNRAAETEVGARWSVVSLLSSRPLHFNLGSDLNLFEPSGNLFKLWKKHVIAHGVPRGLPFSDFLSSAVLDSSESDAPMNRIFSIISAGYFGGAGPDADSARSELENWRAQAELISPISSLQSRLGRDEFLARLKPRLSSVSAGCTAISNAIREGKVPSYIGTSLGAGPGKGGEGGRTGSDLRSGKGGEGGRTGNDVRASRPLTPCLHPDRKI